MNIKYMKYYQRKSNYKKINTLNISIEFKLHSPIEKIECLQNK